MQDFIYFLGRFHVLALHLPIGIVLVAVALDWVARSERNRSLARVSPFLWCAAALSAVLTVALGYMHAAEGGFAGPSLAAHRLSGTVVAVFTLAIWWLSARRPELFRRLNVLTGVAALVLVSITGHYGGNLTHGETFLIQYAPGGLRSGGSAESADGVQPDEALVQRLYQAGFVARPVSPSDPRLVVSVYSPSALVIPQQLAVLESAADEIVELNLQEAGLDDMELERIGVFRGLTRLRLGRNEISDRTVAAIAANMPELERLNLYANPRITDASIDALAGMTSLRRLDIWRTGISEAGMMRLRELRPDLELQGETAEVIQSVQPSAELPNGAR